MLSTPLARRKLASVAAAAAVIAGAYVAPAIASAAPITLQRTIATPIASGPTPATSSPCTVEPKAAPFSNPVFDPAARTDWFGFRNLPSRDDVRPNLAAGVNTDFCVGFELPTDYNPTTRQGYTVQPTDVKDPNTSARDGDDIKDIVIDLPRGFAGNLANFPTCTEAEFGVDGALGVAAAGGNVGSTLAACPDTALVGEAFARITTTFLGQHILVGGADRNAPTGDPEGPMAGAIWRLPSGPNELGRLGVQVYPDIGATRPTKFTVRLTLAPDGSGRVRAIAKNAPRQQVTSGRQDIYVEGIWMRMWGAKADHPRIEYLYDDAFETAIPALSADFAESPTDCSTPADTRFDVTTYGGPRSIPNPLFGQTPPVGEPAYPARIDADPATYSPARSAMTSAPFTVTGCEALPFRPSVSVQTTERTPSTPTGVTVKLGLGQDSEAGRKPALLRNAAVTLPTGLELGAQVASGPGGLPLCSAAQFNFAQSLAPNTCPAATAAGTVKITSPLIDLPLEGRVYLGAQAAVGELPALYIEASQPGATAADAPRVKLVGQTAVDVAGRLTATFKDNLPLRFSELALTFPGGPNALFSTPRTCGEHTAVSQLTSYASAVPKTAPTSLTIDQGCGQIPAFAPTVSFGASNPQAGAFSPTQVTIERPDGAGWLDDVNVSLPAGFLADLNVPTECADTAAEAAACPESSRIGTVTATSGVGARPLALSGNMYLGPPEAGVVAGAVIIVRAKIGELDLGDVIVRGKLRLRPTDAGIDFSADLPTRFRGLALSLRKVVVDLDRPGFALNPAACGPLAYSAVALSDSGEQAKPSGTASYSGCEGLPFQPKLQARLTGEIAPLSHPGMYVKLTKRPQDTNLRSATVVLPEGVAADLKNVQTSCTREQFDTVSCPASTRVGKTAANVSITSETITGDVYLVKVPGETLPGLGLSYNGRFAQRVMSVVKINPQGRLIVRFDTIPDLPLREMTVDVGGGAKGPLQLGKEDCANGTRWDATFVGQGGQVATDQTGLRCAARSSLSLSDKRGLSFRNFDFGGRNLKSAKITLPSGWSIDTKKAKSKKNFARLTGGKTKPKYSKRSISLAIKGTKASTLRVKVIGSAIGKKTKAKKAKTVEVKVRFVFTDGAVQNQTIKVKAK